jgi:hypothetical protein
MPHFSLLMILVLLPLQMLSGGVTPRESMPEFVQQIMTGAPTTHFVKLAQGIIYRGGALDVVWPQFLGLAIIGAVLFSVALLRPRISHFREIPGSRLGRYRCESNSQQRYEQAPADRRVARFAVVRNAQSIARDPAWHARPICLLRLKGVYKMKTTNFRNANAAKSRKSFRPRPRPHDPMLVLNMSIFNSGRSWERIFDVIPRRENVWA